MAVATASGSASTEIYSAECNSEIGDTTLSTGWLIHTLTENSAEFKLALKEGNVEEITASVVGDGECYNSKVYRVVFRFSSRDAYSVIIKVPHQICLENDENTTETVEECLHAANTLDYAAMHNVECAFYEATRGIVDFPMPVALYTRRAHESKREAGAIILEDVGDAGVNHPLGFYQAMTAEQVRNVVRHYAALHAHQIWAKEEERACWESVPCVTEMALAIMSRLMSASEAKEAGDLQVLASKVKPVMTKAFARYAVIDRPKELGLPLIFVHGDSGGHNVFWKKASDGTASNEVLAFYDFQFAFRGNPMYDIGKIMIAFVDANVRRELDDALPQEYYNSLKAALGRLGVQPLSIDLGKLREAYELSKIHACLLPVAGLSVLEAQLGKKLASGEMDAFRETYKLRARASLEDAIASLRKYAPEYLDD
ncbi:calcium/calmodulin-dependent protein kinase type 1 [Aphelenchoides avenae]|nr:calcium/calmodulin-dependent protein kinase type 1 [Aphelenchus avenae]